jgi:hypothetical protein
MDRVVENGKVAVLISPGFGAGWYTWNDTEDLLFDPVIVEMVRNDRRDEIESYVTSAYIDQGIYCGGAEQLQIKWVPIGAEFRVDEYDGAESIVLADHEYWIVA